MGEDRGRSGDPKKNGSADEADLTPTEFTPGSPAGPGDDEHDPDLKATEIGAPASELDGTEIIDATGGAAPRGATVAGAAGDLEEDEAIGNYRLLKTLGEGGMGVVYKAEQFQPVRRMVALKVIRLGMDTKEVVARFEAERQALAVMDHPGIARVYDAGVTDRGRPYFVMEYVEGVPITDYCDQKNLGTLDRLKLFMAVCQAVQHAHQKGVIHRDLKPSNILVTEAAGGALPKIIDFGIAKATGQSQGEKGMQTTLGQLLGTPEYMSPEQADLFTIDIDTRTDIYAMGVILYELLAGDLPFDGKTLRSGGFVSMQKIIKEQEPPRPSTRLTTLGSRQTDIARMRRTEPGTLVRQLRGDLDWIVMMALEKDPARRYQTANAFALDIQRFLDNEPVRARPPSAAYRTRKFIRRNRLAVSAAAALTVALIAGMVGTAVGFVRARRAASEATAISTYLANVLTSVDPSKAQGREITVKEILDEAAASVLESFGGQPEVEASIRNTIGTTYNHLGKFDQAEPHLERALEIYRQRLGMNHETTVKMLNMLAVNYFRQDRLPQAEAMWSEVLTIQRRLTGPESAEALTAANNVAAVLLAQQKYDDAEPLLKEVLEGRTRLLGADDARTNATRNNLAELYKQTRRFEEAEPLYVEGLRHRRGEMGDSHPRTLISVFNLGALYREMGRLEEAEKLCVEARDGFQKVMGGDHPYTLVAMKELTEVLLQQGELAGAGSLAEESYRRHEARYGNDNAETRQVIDQLARIWEARGQPRRAAEWRARLPAAEEEPEPPAGS